MKFRGILFLLLLQTAFLFGQNSDKATVYFSRASSLGILIDFTFFDGETVIGKFNGGKYMKYECEPGKHLFWAKAENTSFMDAELKAGEIYVIDVVPQMGAIRAGVLLVAVDINYRKLKPIQKLLTKKAPTQFSKTDLQRWQNNKKGIIASAMQKYQNKKRKGKNIKMLSANKTLQEEDLIFTKKKNR